MSITRRALLAAPLALPALVRQAHAARPLLVASLLGEDKPETLIWTHIRDRLEAIAPGAFSFNIVANAALGGEKAVAEGVKLGSIQASLSTLSNLSAWVPQSQLFDLPFLFRDDAHLQAALAGEPGQAVQQELEAQGFIAPAFIDYGARHLLAPRPLTDPEALDGKRIRVIGSPLHAALWQSFGALPIALPITETYNALATSHVDAMDLTRAAYAGFRLFEVAPHVTLTAHIRAAGAVLFSGRFWSGLADEEKAMLRQAAGEGAAHFNALMMAEEKAASAVAEAGGAQFHAVADLEPWQEPARKVWHEFSGQVGGMDAIRMIGAL
jgi:TRAP-type C4-dicarboxylate transport system substrate-binding protein